MPEISLGKLILTVGEPETLFLLANADDAEKFYRLTLPRFEINWRNVESFVFTGNYEQRELPRGGVETVLHFETELVLPIDVNSLPALELQVVIRSFSKSPFLRFRYILSSSTPVALTKTEGKDNIRYFAVSKKDEITGWGGVVETQLSHFDPVIHSYLPYATK